MKADVSFLSVSEVQELLAQTRGHVEFLNGRAWLIYERELSSNAMRRFVIQNLKPWFLDAVKG